MKKLLGLTIAFVLAFTLAACDIGETDEEGLDENKTYSYMSVEINPRIEFIVDDEGNVESYLLKNEDAEIVAADLDFEGMDAEEALELFLDTAVEMGYIDVDADDNAVFITTGSEDEDEEEGIRERMRGRAEEYFRAHAIGAAVIDEVLDEDLIALAEEHDIGLGRMVILYTATEIDEDLTIEEAVEMEMREIMEIVNEHHRERMNEFREQRREEAREMADAMREEARERVQEHRQRVEDGEIGPPDLDEYRHNFRENIEEKMENHRQRMEERRQNARDRMPVSENNPQAP